MSEEDELSPMRETIVKRPDEESSRSLTESLKLDVSCMGVLEKLATGLFVSQ